MKPAFPALAVFGLLAASPALALTPATQGTNAAGLVHQAQYRDWDDRPRFRGPPPFGPRRVCRIERTRVVNERTGRVRIIEREVCRPRGPRW